MPSPIVVRPFLVRGTLEGRELIALAKWPWSTLKAKGMRAYHYIYLLLFEYTLSSIVRTYQ